MQIKSVHPIADLFPMMSEEELSDLAADIKTNGQLHPIIVDDDGQLIDGRNRKRACEIAGVELWTEKLNGHDATAMIVSANLARRNLSKGQKAMALAMIRPEAGHGGARQKGSSSETKLEISKARISQARTVLHFSRELALRVMSGQEPLDAALVKVTDEQKRLQSDEEQLARLRIEAPDLADLVAEERMKLSEAISVFIERKREEAALEQNRRDTLMKLTNAGYSGTVAWSNREFAQSVRDRLGDDNFRRALLQSLRLKSSDIANIKPGAAALAEVLSQLANGGHIDE